MSTFSYQIIGKNETAQSRPDVEKRFFDHRSLSKWEDHDCYVITKDGYGVVMQCANNELFSGDTPEEIAGNHIAALLADEQQQQIEINRQQQEQALDASAKAADALIKWKQLFDSELIDEATYETQKSIVFASLNIEKRN